MRFAFYGRVSTEDQQDPEASRGWQLARARSLIEPHGGGIVAEFFDEGQSRSLPWERRPEAATLLAEVRSPARRFDAVVVGELARAFGDHIDQGLVLRVLEHNGVELWHPDAGGAHSSSNIGHRITANLRADLAQEEREVMRQRVRSSMKDQTAREGRFLGGRPPYGYTLGDAGPHPNPSKAADGRRLRRLERDATAAPIVTRIFEEYLDGAGLYAIAEGLTRDGIPSPSAHDPARNRHRTGSAWSKSAVRAILKNPRYTGRQVWNRQHRAEGLIDDHRPEAGFRSTLRWSDRADWVWSSELVHETLVDVETFARAQEQMAAGVNRPATRKPRRSPRPYVLRGILNCGICGRRMGGHWLRGETRYRCRYPAEYALANDVDHPRTVYVREDEIVEELDRWLGRLFDPAHIDETCALLASAGGPDDADSAGIEAARRALADCDTRLGRYRAALESGADAQVVAAWIAEVQGARLAAERALAAATPSAPLEAGGVRALVDELGDVASALEDADPDAKARLYGDLGICLVYRPADRVVTVEAAMCATARVGGGFHPERTRVLRGELRLASRL